MIPLTVLKYAPHLIGVIVIGLVLNYLHGCVYDAGANSVLVEYQAKELVHQQELEKTKEYIAMLEASNRYENRRINDELAKAKSDHEATVARINADYSNRLQSAKVREDKYKRLAEGGTSECRDLASYATRFDSTIEEGRHLVRELKETLRFRDGQLILLGNQIQSDRALISKAGTNDGR